MKTSELKDAFKKKTEELIELHKFYNMLEEKYQNLERRSHLENAQLVDKIANNSRAEQDRLNNAYHKGYRDGYTDCMKDKETPSGGSLV